MSVDRESILQAYEDVRSDVSDTTWAAFSYDDEDGKTIRCSQTGQDYSEFIDLIQVNEMITNPSTRVQDKRALYSQTGYSKNVHAIRMGMDVKFQAFPERIDSIGEEKDKVILFTLIQENMVKILQKVWSTDDHDSIDDNRLYCYLRVETGDEMSKRAKFALITWIGKNLSTLKKAKVSTDKAFVKQLCQNFAVEVLAEGNKNEISYDTVRNLCIKAGGANYGTGVRN